MDKSVLVTNLPYSNWFAGISSNRINIWGIYMIFWSMLGWWNHGSSTLGWSRLQGCSRDHQDDKSTFTMNSSWLGSPITQRYLHVFTVSGWPEIWFINGMPRKLKFWFLLKREGMTSQRTKGNFYLQRKGVVEANDIRFPPQLKWIETVGQKIGICEMQCCSDMVRHLYLYIVWIFIWFGNAETWLTHLWQSKLLHSNRHPFLWVRLKMSDPPNRMEMMNLSRKKYWFWWDAW